MQDKLKTFLDDAFKPYGAFPSRDDVMSELLANLQEKYKDLKAQGHSDQEAYRLTTESFGDVAEIMETIPGGAPAKSPEQAGTLRKTLKNAFQQMTGKGSKFMGTDLHEADLAGTNLPGEDFSGSALTGTVFDDVNLAGASFNGSALAGASFKKAVLTGAIFGASDLQGVWFDDADLTGATFGASDLQQTSMAGATLANTTFKACSLKDMVLTGATLDGVKFIHSDASGLAFDGLTLRGVEFNSCSLRDTSFRGAVLTDVLFRSTVKHAVFDGATMDKVTYALLKGAKANLDNVTIQ